MIRCGSDRIRACTLSPKLGAGHMVRGDVPGELHFDDISTHPVMNWPMSGDVSQFNDVMQPISGDIGGFQ